MKTYMRKYNGESLGTATMVTIDGEVKTLRYHNTDVVKVDESIVAVKSGGWETTTTKKKINLAFALFGIEASVYQSKGDWYLVANGQTMPFTNGMTFTI